MIGRSRENEFLYIAYESPPLVGGGVGRTMSNCKLLREYGWRPTLLTCTVDHSDDVDKGLGLQGIEVIRPRCVMKENRFRALPRGTGRDKAPLSTRLLRFTARWLLIPDRFVLWKLRAIRPVLRAAKEHNWKCVYAAQPPISGIWTGRIIASRLGLPFILEFQDVISEKFPGGPPTFIHRWLRSRIVRTTVRSAERIVVMSNAMKEWVAQTYCIEPHKIEVIPIGFLPETREFFRSVPQSRNDRFTMLYAGMFSRERKPDTTLKAVRLLIDENMIPADKLRLVFIGNLLPSVITDFGLDGVAEAKPHVPHEEVLKWYAQADLLLLICDKCRYQTLTVPGKTYEYLMTEKPVLGLVDKGCEIADIIKKSGVGIAVDADEPRETADEIARIYSLWQDNKLIMKPDKKAVEEFNYRNLVGRLVSVMEDVVSENV
jgi:glycosyltransferase involved in cell wall biosynthesis